MDPVSLIVTIYSKCEAILQALEKVKTCKLEATRLGLRVHNLVRTLKDATESFRGNTSLQARPIELNSFMSTLPPLLEECTQCPSFLSKVLQMQRVGELRASLKDSEHQLQSLCSDLGLEMLQAIGQKLDLLCQTQPSAEESATTEASAASKLEDRVFEAVKCAMQELGRESGSLFRTILDEPTKTAGSRQIGRGGRLQGKICWDQLQETGHIVGEGSFGAVYSGLYFERRVAIKKASVVRLGPRIEDELRWVEQSFELRGAHPISKARIEHTRDDAS